MSLSRQKPQIQTHHICSEGCEQALNKLASIPIKSNLITKCMIGKIDPDTFEMTMCSEQIQMEDLKENNSERWWFRLNERTTLQIARIAAWLMITTPGDRIWSTKVLGSFDWACDSSTGDYEPSLTRPVCSPIRSGVMAIVITIAQQSCCSQSAVVKLGRIFGHALGFHLLLVNTSHRRIVMSPINSG